MFVRTMAVLACSVLFVQCGIAGATELDIDTGTSPNWTVSAGGAADVPPYIVNGSNNDLSITSDSFNTGTPISGLNLSTFDGYWTANFAFDLPANAVDPTLSYSKLTGDDRLVLELNGVPIASAGYVGGSGYMTLTDGGTNVPYEFSANKASGTITDGFILGGPNLLTAIINNTGNGIDGSPKNISATDGTDFGVQGDITYTSAVPEPATAALGLIGLAGLLVRRRSRLV